MTALYLEDHAAALVRDRDVLELGAAGGLPSLICIAEGARLVSSILTSFLKFTILTKTDQVTPTDWPDEDLLANLRLNVDNLRASEGQSTDEKAPSVYVEGLKWGYPIDDLVARTGNGHGFDTIILADLLFNHCQHAALIATLEATLKRAHHSVALVFFTPHRPWLKERDFAFFDLARRSGFAVAKVVEELMERPMFEDDRGDELTRRTVYGFEVRWSDRAV